MAATHHSSLITQHSPVIGRLAPSPTGAQHVGNARTYLIAWLAARSRRGRVVLRIEDIDSPRIKPGAAQAALDDLRWLGMDWDEGPVFQTERLPLYESALRTLQSRELVYPCTCSRADVERAASAPHAEHEGPAYPGTCARRTVASATSLGDQPFVWRFRVKSESLEFIDGFRGPTQVRPREVGGDFVVWKVFPWRPFSPLSRFRPLKGPKRPKGLKGQGSPAYQLAVVVDDAAQQVTEVIRGDDLVPSTPRQLLLYEALGLPPPRFVHVPLVVGPDGRRLAKRHGDTRLASLRQAGVRAEALVGLLAWSCGWIEKPRSISARELIPLFRLDTIPRQAFVLTPENLASIAASAPLPPLRGRGQR